MKQVTPDSIAQALLAAKDAVPLRTWLWWLFGEAGVRDFCRSHDVAPRGFRIEKAPFDLLLGSLEKAFAEREDVRTALCQRLASIGHRAARPAGVVAPDPAAPESDEAMRARASHEQEVARLTQEAQKARDVAERRGARVEELQREVDRLTHDRASLRAECEALRGQLRGAGGDRPAADPHAESKTIESLRRQIEQLESLNLELRRQSATDATTIQSLSTELEDTRARSDWKKRPPAPAPTRDDLPTFTEGFAVPYLTDEFYRSLAGRERRVVQAAFQAIFLLCTQGPAYPGLETKRLGGADGLWSIRATLKHRLYFEQLPTGEVRFLRIEDRQAQDRFLRLHRDR